MAKSRDFYDRQSPDLKLVLGPMFARIEALEAQVATLQAATPVDTSNLVTTDAMKKYVDAAINQKLP